MESWFCSARRKVSPGRVVFGFGGNIFSVTERCSRLTPLPQNATEGLLEACARLFQACGEVTGVDFADNA